MRLVGMHSCHHSGHGGTQMRVPLSYTMLEIIWFSESSAQSSNNCLPVSQHDPHVHICGTTDFTKHKKMLNMQFSYKCTVETSESGRLLKFCSNACFLIQLYVMHPVFNLIVIIMKTAYF